MSLEDIPDFFQNEFNSNGNIMMTFIKLEQISNVLAVSNIFCNCFDWRQKITQRSTLYKQWVGVGIFVQPPFFQQSVVHGRSFFSVSIYIYIYIDSQIVTRY